MLSYSPRAVYHLAKLLYPDGHHSNKFLPITIEGQVMELRFSTDRGHGDDVEFLLHFPKTEYARRNPMVYEDGRIDEDTAGVVPDFDRLENEHIIQSTVDELLQVIFSTLLKHLGEKLKEAK